MSVAAKEDWCAAFDAALARRRRRPTVVRFSIAIETAVAMGVRPDMHEERLAEGATCARVRVSVSAARSRATFSFRYSRTLANGFREIHTVRIRVRLGGRER